MESRSRESQGGAGLRASASAGKGFRLSVTGTDNLSVGGGEWFDGHDKGKGKGHALAAADGRFGSSLERMKATINTRGWKRGIHTISIRVRDRAGSWSKVVKVKIRV